MRPALRHFYFLSAVIALIVLCSVSLRAVKDKDDYDYSERTVFMIDTKKEDGKLVYTLKSKKQCRYIFLSEESTERTTFSISEHQFDIVSDIEASLADDDVPNRYIWSNFAESRDVFVSDSKIWTIRLPHKAKVQNEFEYSYKREYKGIEFMPLIYVPNYEKLSGYQVVFEHPEGVRIDVEAFFPMGKIDYKITRESEKTIIDVAKVQRQLYKTHFPFDGYHILFIPKISVGGKQLNPTTHDDFVRWYNGIFSFNRDPGDKNYDSLKTVISSLSSNREKLRAIYDYVRSNVRYIADEQSLGAIVPRPPSFVLEKRYGDCKDKAFCVSQLAQKFGIPAYMALISTDPEPELKDTHMSMYDHAICCAELDGKTVFMDPTCKYCEFGNLPNSDIENQALIANPAAPRFVPMVPLPERKTTVEVRIESDIQNLKQGSARIILRNEKFWAAQYAINDMSSSEVKNFLSAIVSAEFQKMAFDSFAIVETRGAEIEFKAQCDLSNFVIQSPTKRYIPQTPFNAVDADVLERSGDSLGLYSSELPSMRMQIDLKIGDASGQTQQAHFGNADLGVQYNAEMKVGQSGTYQFVYDFQQSHKVYKGNRQSEYIEFCRQYLAAKKNMFSLVKN